MNRIKSIQVKKKMLRDEDVASIESESSESDDIIEETDDDVFFGNEKDISIKEKPKIEIGNNNKANIRKRFLKQISKKIQPLSSPKNTQLKMKRSSYFELLQSKQIFQKFLCIGIDESGLETIEDMDELMLMPKITFNFPNNKSENELEL